MKMCVLIISGIWNLRLTKNEEIARQKEKTENEIEYCILVVQGSQHF